MRTLFGFVCIVILAASLSGQETPMPPLTGTTVTCFPDTTGYTRITVGPVDRDYSDLQDAIDAAFLGTVIVLDAGVTFSGEYTLPYKGEGEDWVILISSRMDLLPGEEGRIDPLAATGDAMFPTQADAMPKISSTAPEGLIPAIATNAYAHHYRLVGIEVTIDPSVTQNFGLINLGTASSEQSTLGIVPYAIIIDRCYMHGHNEMLVMKYGVGINCRDCAVIDSYMSEIHSMTFESHAIFCINGPGPFRILNNYLEAAGRTIYFGGGAPVIAGLVPSDIEIRQNHFLKPWSWREGHPEYAGKHWAIRSHIQLKTGNRVLIDGNVMENCWADLPNGQNGYAVLLNVSYENGNATQANVSDVMLSNNIIKNAGAGVSLTGINEVLESRSLRIMLSNNLFDNINGPAYGDQNTSGPNDGTFIYIGEPQDVWFDHNTILQTGAITWAYDTMSGFQYTNNLSLCSASAGGFQGIYGDGLTQGDNTFATFFPDVTDAGMEFNRNVLIGGDMSLYADFNTLSQNYFPATTDDVMFVDYANGPDDYHNYALSSMSPYAMAGTDGKDIGVNMTALDSAFSAERECDMSTALPYISRINPILELYPNPTSDILNVSVKIRGSLRYVITDIHGRIIRSGTDQGEIFRIDTEDLIPGVYTLGILSQEGNGYRKFVVE